MKIEVRDINIHDEWSEEPIAFHANLYVNDRKIGETENRGNGGCTRYFILKVEDAESLRQAEEFCKTLPPYKIRNYPSEGQETEFPMDLETFIDNAVNEEFEKMELKTFNEKLEKDQLDSIVFGIKDKSYRRHRLENTVDEMLKTRAGIKVLECKILYKISKWMKEDENILNTNLPEELITLSRRPNPRKQVDSDLENRPRSRKSK
ncbi:hypothetical protein [Niabella sp.]|uniref:hypothetical protein n=1 Tax=Niabella sp. TaxID=1962976 RepID=UPI00260DCDB2|nr:hypothetical protein [Niabella sp.]